MHLNLTLLIDSLHKQLQEWLFRKMLKNTDEQQQKVLIIVTIFLIARMWSKSHRGVKTGPLQWPAFMYSILFYFIFIYMIPLDYNLYENPNALKLHLPLVINNIWVIHRGAAKSMIQCDFIIIIYISISILLIHSDGLRFIITHYIWMCYVWVAMHVNWI